jgi:phenylacetate-CoA ligase
MRGPHAPDPLEPPELFDRDRLRAQQLERLRSTVRRVHEHVPHYRRKFEAAGVRPEDLKSLADLARFPFTTKQDLRETYPFGMFAVPMDEVVRVHASSGTTGKPTVVGYTKRDIEMWSDVMARSIRAAGGTERDVVHNALGYGLFTGGLGVHYGAERLGAAVVPIAGGQSERQVQLIVDFGATFISSTPSYMLALAEEFARQGIDARGTRMRVALLGAEPWTNEMRAEIEDRFAIDAIELYGLSELIGPGVACEFAETKDGPHVWEDLFYPEVIDPVTGDVLPDGESGELVFTSLAKEALPVVRYRTRDLSRLLPGTARPALRRIAKITGRSDDMLIIRGVNVFPSQIEEVLFKQPDLAPHYQLELWRDDRHLDQLNVLVEMKPERSVSDEAARAAAAHAFQHHIKSLVGITAHIKVLPTGAVERSIGKAKRVIDNRPKN